MKDFITKKPEQGMLNEGLQKEGKKIPYGNPNLHKGMKKGRNGKYMSRYKIISLPNFLSFSPYTSESVSFVGVEGGGRQPSD